MSELGRRIAGIDSGVNGAVALYLPDAVVPTVPNGLVDLPTVGESNRRELNYAALRDILWEFKPDVVFLEVVNAMPAIDNETGERTQKMGATSLMRFGGAFYAIKAVVACLDIPLRIAPTSWKGHFGLKGGKPGKEQARQLAIQRYPTLAPFLKRKLDHQRAEAFLIAAFGVAVLEGKVVRNVRAKPSGDAVAIDKRRLRDADVPDVPE